MLPRVLLLTAAIIWGWTFVATKVLVAELGPVEIFSLRLAIGIPVLGGLLLVRRVPLRFERRDVAPLAAAGSVFVAHFLIQIAGIETTSATNTAWIVSVAPLALAVMSYFLLGERIGRRGVAGIVLATLGVVVLVSRGRLADLGWLRSTGDWLVFASAHTWALYTVATRNLVQRRHPLAVTFGVLSIAGLVMMLVFVAAADLDAVASLSPSGIAAVLYLAIPGFALGQWFWQEGVARLGATRAGLYLYLEPIATLALAVPMLGEPFGPIAATGAAMVLVGVYFGQRDAAAGRGTVPAMATIPE